MPMVSKYPGSTLLVVAGIGEPARSATQSEPDGISGNEDVSAAARTPGSARNRCSACV